MSTPVFIMKDIFPMVIEFTTSQLTGVIGNVDRQTLVVNTFHNGGKC